MSSSSLRLQSGKLLLGHLLKNRGQDCHVYVQLSSDAGRTWRRSRRFVQRPAVGGAGEPGVVELRDGRLSIAGFCARSGFPDKEFAPQERFRLT